MLRMLRWAGNAILIVILLSALLVFFGPRVLGWQFLYVISGSMSPTFEVGGVIMVQPVDPRNIQANDIIVFKSGGGDVLVTHRVVEVIPNPLGFRTKGDANKSPDDYVVSYRNVVGQVRFHFPVLGYVVNYMKTPLGFVLSLTIPGALLIFGEVWNMVKATRPGKPAKEKAAAGQADPPKGDSS